MSTLGALGSTKAETGSRPALAESRVRCSSRSTGEDDERRSDRRAEAAEDGNDDLFRLFTSSSSHGPADNSRGRRTSGPANTSGSANQGTHAAWGGSTAAVPTARLDGTARMSRAGPVGG